MTQIEHLREQAQRAERLARNVLDALTVARLLEASQEYRRLANDIEWRAHAAAITVTDTSEASPLERLPRI